MGMCPQINNAFNKHTHLYNYHINVLRLTTLSTTITILTTPSVAFFSKFYEQTSQLRLSQHNFALYMNTHNCYMGYLYTMINRSMQNSDDQFFSCRRRPCRKKTINHVQIQTRSVRREIDMLQIYMQIVGMIYQQQQC